MWRSCSIDVHEVKSWFDGCSRRRLIIVVISCQSSYGSDHAHIICKWLYVRSGFKCGKWARSWNAVWHWRAYTVSEDYNHVLVYAKADYKAKIPFLQGTGLIQTNCKTFSIFWSQLRYVSDKINVWSSVRKNGSTSEYLISWTKAWSACQIDDEMELMTK